MAKLLGFGLPTFAAHVKGYPSHILPLGIDAHILQVKLFHLYTMS